MKPTTLEEALKLVPEYILLRPGVDSPNRQGDEYRVESRREWVPAGYIFDDINRKVERGAIIRRPLPTKVREAMARNILERVSKAGTLAKDEIIGAHSWVEYYKL